MAEETFRILSTLSFFKNEILFGVCQHRTTRKAVNTYPCLEWDLTSYSDVQALVFTPAPAVSNIMNQLLLCEHPVAYPLLIHLPWKTVCALVVGLPDAQMVCNG
jgi:hypothetical protein